MKVIDFVNSKLVSSGLFVESKSWTPKILNDIVGRKKIQSECEDNPLELLPEKRSKKILKKKIESPDSNKENLPLDSGNEQVSLFSAINFLLTEVFSNPHSRQYQQVDEMKGDSILARSLNYLFVESETNAY